MAKKTNRVSINALERFCKEATPDIMQRTFSIGDETITYEVKFRLTLEESMRFIEDVVKEAVMPNDGMIVPLAQSYIIGKNILVYYANFTMPSDESKAYELVLGANGIIGDIIGCIDNAQYQMLLAGVRDRVNFETQKVLSVQEQRVNTLVGEISRFAEQMDSVFGNISGEQMAGFISSMSKLSDTQISTEELAKAFVENAKENN